MTFAEILASLTWDYWFMFFVAFCIATTAMASGIEGAAFFAPIFILLPPPAGGRLDWHRPNHRSVRFYRGPRLIHIPQADRLPAWLEDPCGDGALGDCRHDPVLYLATAGPEGGAWPPAPIARPGGGLVPAPTGQRYRLSGRGEGCQHHGPLGPCDPLQVARRASGQVHHRHRRPVYWPGFDWAGAFQRLFPGPEEQRFRPK